MSGFRSTTVLAIRHNGKVAMGGDGQVSLGDTVVKHNARKVQKLSDGKVLAGFAGAAADSFALFEKFEGKLDEYNGNLKRAAVELAKDWRLDKYLRHLDALLAVADKDCLFMISGSGDVIEPDDGILAIGSGAAYALAAARAYVEVSKLDAKTIVKRALEIAASICVFTNSTISIEEL